LRDIGLANGGATGKHHSADAAKARGGLVNGVLHRFGTAHIHGGTVAVTIGAEFGLQLPGGSFIGVVGKKYSVPVLLQSVANGAAQAAAAAYYQRCAG